MAPTIKVGDTIPDAQLGYVPYSPELEDPIVCGLPCVSSLSSPLIVRVTPS